MIPLCLYLFVWVLLPLQVKSQAQQLKPMLSPHCYRSTNLTGACIAVNNSAVERLCLGAKIPFTHTSLALAGDSNSLKEVDERLRLWTGLQNVPQCWAVVQPFLCSVYLPKCTDQHGVMLPSKQLCERTRKPCQIVHDFNNGWPDFLQCDHPNFVSGCGPENYDYVSFNTTGKCEPPLVRTVLPESWYPGVEGCGMPCDNPLFSQDEHKRVHTFVAVFGSICLLCTLFTVMTFIIDWKNANRYPALIIFFINACFLLGSVGWMVQFAGDAREEIVCRKDGTVRRGEPQLGSRESVWCPVIFTLVYYFLVAGICWYVMLAYAWCLTFTALGGSTASGKDPGTTPREVLQSRTSYFHIISWCCPLVLTIICLAVSEIDGDSLSGICFVGVHNHGSRALFVLAPVGLVIVVGTFFLVRGVYTLTKIRNDAPAFIPEKTFSKIRSTIVRLGVFSAVALGFVFITFGVHIYIFTNEDKWRQSFREYMLCKVNTSVSVDGTDSDEACSIKDRPSLLAMQLHIFAFFGAGIAMSSWSWTRASLSSWERFFRWVFHKPSNKPVKLKRHRVIAQMFEKRKEINQGRMSISYRSSHDDPLGMKFDFNSGSDDELSSNFAMAMPQLVRRRGGVIFPMSSMGRRHSDSDVTSISTRRVSRESLVEFRDAQYVIVDRDGLPAFALPQSGRGRSGRGRRKKVMKTRKQRKRDKLSRVQPLTGPVFTGSRFGSFGKSSSRKGSDSSVLSQLSAASMRFFKIRRRQRNSLDSESVNSNLPPASADGHGINMISQGSTLPPISTIQPRPRLEFGPAKRKTDFGVLSSKKSGGSNCGSSKGSRKEVDIELGVKGGLGEAASPTGRGMEAADVDETCLSVAPVESEADSMQAFRSRMKQQKQQEREMQAAVSHNSSRNKNDSFVSRNSSSTQASSSEDEVEQMMWEQMQRQQLKQQQAAPPATATTTTKQQLRTVTVETHHHELRHQKQNEEEECRVGGKRASSLPPLHALMADISCGNWGVLLGKSGSSSGSEAGGFSIVNRNIPMGRPAPPPAPPPPAPANPNNFIGGGVGPYAMTAGRNPYMGGAYPQPFMPYPPPEAMMGGAYPYIGNKGYEVGGTYPYMGKRGYEMGGAYPYMGKGGYEVGGAYPYMGKKGYEMGGAYPYMGKKGYEMGGAYPGFMGVEGHQFGGSMYPPYMSQGMAGMGGGGYVNNVFAQSYNMGDPDYHAAMAMGGARPKSRENWGPVVPQPHYPPANPRAPHQGMVGGRRSQERRFARERQKEREMRRPNNGFFNSTFDMEDDEIESISVV